MFIKKMGLMMMTVVDDNIRHPTEDNELNLFVHDNQPWDYRQTQVFYFYELHGL